MNAKFGPIALNVLYELIKLLGNTENYDKFSIEQIEDLINNEQEIKEILKSANDKNYPKLKEFLNANDFVKEQIYECIKKKILEYKRNQWQKLFSKKYAKFDLIDGKYIINKLNNNDIIKIKMFGKVKEIQVYSRGDSFYNAGGDDVFQLTNEEIALLNWFLNNIKIEDYKNEIVDYCNEVYSSWVYFDGTMEGPIGIENLENEIDIFQIAIKVEKSEGKSEIAFAGGCNCDEDHGICICFRDKKFFAISSQDWVI